MDFRFMTQFFSPEDFYFDMNVLRSDQCFEIIASIANTKLERQGNVIDWHGPSGVEKAILLNLKAVKKEWCNHAKGGIATVKEGKVAKITCCTCGKEIS